MLADPRPDFTLLSNPILEREPPVLFPDQWEDSVSPSGDFEVKAASPPSGQDDKPSPDSGCSLRFNSRTSSPDRTAAKSETSGIDFDSLLRVPVINRSVSLFPVRRGADRSSQ